MSSRHDHELRYIEFYAGIGGWTMALHDLAPSSHCCAAYDHSDVCRSVFEHNFQRPCLRTPIEQLSLKELSELAADLWMMSPPCQPHTRQHDNSNDLEDPRSSSFLHLCQVLNDMETPPRIILLENVDGFQSSSSWKCFMNALQSRKYNIAQFLLQPTQVGLPNDRPRYYIVALLHQLQPRDDSLSVYFTQSIQEATPIHTSIPELNVLPFDEDLPLPSPIANFLDDTIDSSLQVPIKLLQDSKAWCFDIVTPQSTRSACFTSGYGRFVRGTGSILYTGKTSTSSDMVLQDPQHRTFDENWWKGIDDLTKFRYFSGTELARLFGFADSFRFPETITRKQQWKLMGNSLNVRVATKLIELALRASKMR